MGGGPRARGGVSRRTRRTRTLAALAVLVLAGVLIGVLSGGGASRPASTSAHAKVAAQSRPVRFAGRRLPAGLPLPLQDAAAVALPGAGLALFGGLDESDTSTSGVIEIAGLHVSTVAQLPLSQHDAQGALVDGAAYIFGGGQVSSYDHVLRYDHRAGGVSRVGVLPTAASDVAVAALGGSAYVVGGYDGSRALDTVLAWRPGQPARTVARLPLSLRYAAVAASGGALIIAGGSHGEAAEDEILRFEPASGRLQAIGRLPRPVTHASAVALGSFVYLLGGRGAAGQSQSADILAIDPRDGTVTSAGRLPLALSDAAAAVVGGRIMVAGGQSAAGQAQSAILLLEPRTPASGG